MSVTQYIYLYQKELYVFKGILEMKKEAEEHVRFELPAAIASRSLGIGGMLISTRPSRI